MMLFILLLFRGNTDKEDHTEDKLDGLQKQVVSHTCCVGDPHSLYCRERSPRLGNGLRERDCSAAVALNCAQHFIIRIVGIQTALHFHSSEAFDFDITVDFRCICEI